MRFIAVAAVGAAAPCGSGNCGLNDHVSSGVIAEHSPSREPRRPARLQSTPDFKSMIAGAPV